MRFFFTLLVGVLVSMSAGAAGKAKPKFQVQFLTYNQLLALPKAKRMEYVRDITKLMIKMERYNAGYETAGMSLRDLREQFAMFQEAVSILPEANARASDKAGKPALGAIPLWDGEQYICRPGYEFNESVPGCLKLNSEGSTYYDTSEVSSCGDGMVEIPHPDSYFGPKNGGAKVYKSAIACMSKRNFALLDPDKRAAILERKDPWLSPNTFNRWDRESQNKLVYGATNGVAPSADGMASAGTEGSGAPSAPVGAATTAPAAPAAPAATVTAAPPAPAPAPAAPAPAQKAEAPKSEPKAEPKSDPKADSCLPQPVACSDSPDQEAIDRFRKTADYKGVDANKCIAGGILAKYPAGKGKKAGTCQPETKFGPMTCDPGMVLCSPVLFCHTLKLKNGKPSRQIFCVNRTDEKGRKDPNWTARCAKEYESRLAKTKAVDLYRDPKTGKFDKDKVERYDQGENQPKACDPQDFVAGGHEDWNRMTKELKDMIDVWCNGTADFKALFCKECQIITAHVYKMNKKAVDNGCGTANSNGAAATETPAATEGEDDSKTAH